MPKTHSIQDLSNFIGTWDCKETFHAGGWTPTENVTDNARDVFSWGPGGKFIVADYESISAIGLFEAHDVMYWDARAEKFKFHFFDSFSGGVDIQDGVLEGDVLTFTSRSEMNGAAGALQRVYTFVSPTQQSLEVRFVPDEGAVVRIATIEKKKR